MESWSRPDAPLTWPTRLVRSCRIPPCANGSERVPWSEHEDAKLWYQRVKSRPSFRPLLADLLPGAPPPPHYADLDF